MCIEEAFLTTLVVKGMSNKDMARKCFVDEPKISRLVNGEASFKSLDINIEFNFQILDILFPDGKTIHFELTEAEELYDITIAAIGFVAQIAIS